MIPASSTDFMSNLANLDRHFGLRLHDAKNTSATAAFMAIRNGIFDRKKEEIIEQLILSFAFGQVSLERVRRPVTATRLCSLFW